MNTSNFFGSFNNPNNEKSVPSNISDTNSVNNPWNSWMPWMSSNPGAFSSNNNGQFQPKYMTEQSNNYGIGYNAGFENGFNMGYSKAIAEINKNNHTHYISKMSTTPIVNNTNEYTSGYDCGIQNYINAVNLINSYNPKVPTTNTQNVNVSTNKNFKKHKHNKNTKNKNWNKPNKKTSNKFSKKEEDYDDLDFSSSIGERKPILIIKKISKDQNSDTNDFGSMFTNFLKGGDDDSHKDNINYLEDSDDDNDNLVSIDDIKCNDDYVNKKKKEFNNIKIISLKEIIEKNNIVSIDDLITIGNYYEKNFLTNKTPENDKNKQEDEKEDENNDDEDIQLMESFIKSLGIPIAPNTNIIINNKTKKKILTPKNIKSITPKTSVENKNDCSNTFELYKIKDSYFTINLEKVYNMKGHLIKLKKMIGLDNIKNEIIDMILYYLMEFEKKNNNMLHMTLEGSPGCGKTKLAKIISKLLGAMGILDNDKVVYARRTDMIGQYLGQTGQKTQKIIDSALGGVLFIDEAYSLGNSKKDIYSKECLDILNQNLSDNKKKLICIIAGYPEELENYFFSSNPGLTRRFPFRFKINNYTHTELLNIFINKINKLKWKLDNNTKLEEFFEKNILHFKFFGGDIDTFIQDIKYSHSRRVVCAHPSEFRIINKNDIKNAFEKFKNRRKNDNSECWKGMYV